MEVLGLIIGLIFVIALSSGMQSRNTVNKKFQEYDMSKVSVGKLAIARNKGASTYEIRKGIIEGKYNKDDQFKL